jgi:hypothetical protein
VNPDVVKWLESAEGQRWSRGFHNTSGNQTHLVSVKEADQFEHKAAVLLQCAMTITTDLEGWS